MTDQKAIEKFVGAGRIKKELDITPFFTIKTGVVTPFFFEAESRDDLINAQKASFEFKIPLLIIGGGSNLVMAKPEKDLLIVRNRYIQKKVIEDNDQHVRLLVSSGLPISVLVNFTTAAGYEGFEYHLGLPGTLGGAVFMNSKWTNPPSYVGDNLIAAEIVDREGNRRQVDAAYFRFKYGYSQLQETQEILVTATFRLRRADPITLQQIATESLAYRKKTQPFGVASSGCFFKNNDGTSAGMIIDKLGLKGYRIGNLVVSEKHANFIINEGNASASDFKKMINHIKSQAHKNLGVKLTEEVRFLS